jgi:translocation and assembly module TamA
MQGASLERGCVRPQATALFAVLVTAAAWGEARAADGPQSTPVIEGELTNELRSALAQALAESGGASPSRFEARRRALSGGEAAIALLRSEGYYAHQVEADLLDQDGGVNQPVVRIDPGQRFLIADPKVVWAAPQPDLGAATVAFGAMNLMEGMPGRAADVLAAEGRIIAAIQQRGYADAIADTREVIADHADQTLRPTFNITSGPLVKLGAVRVQTRGRTSPEWAANLAPWKVGETYAPDSLAELERRLRETRVYDQVSIALQPATEAESGAPRPVIVSLADRAPRTVELGAGFSTSEGAGLDARWIRYNQLRRADTNTYTGRLAQLEQRLDGELSLPQWRGAQQTLRLGAALYHLDPDAFEETGVGARADLTRRYGRSSFRTFGISADLSRTRQKVTRAGMVTGQARDLAAVAGLAAISWDNSDDPLNPRRGWRVEARTEPTAITGDSGLLFLKTQAQASAYLPLDAAADTVVAGRLKLGTILGGTIPGVPASRRFFAGGGGSVRGYAYQAIGPRLSDNTPEGGVSLAEASLEIRRRVIGAWSAVAFVDAGGVGGLGFPGGEDFSVGAGVGVRYDLGFGPIRADIAFPLDRRTGDPAFQLYISIGQSF